jgi:hypothetical protein
MLATTHAAFASTILTTAQATLVGLGTYDASGFYQSCTNNSTGQSVATGCSVSTSGGSFGGTGSGETNVVGNTDNGTLGVNFTGSIAEDSYEWIQSDAITFYGQVTLVGEVEVSNTTAGSYLSISSGLTTSGGISCPSTYSLLYSGQPSGYCNEIIGSYSEVITLNSVPYTLHEGATECDGDDPPTSPEQNCVFVANGGDIPDISPSDFSIVQTLTATLTVGILNEIDAAANSVTITGSVIDPLAIVVYNADGTVDTGAIITTDFSAQSSAVPEPASLLLMGGGLAVLGLIRRPKSPG